MTAAGATLATAAIVMTIGLYLAGLFRDQRHEEDSQ